jgi:dimethylaniline monooxygenase (N-oxide forming)
MEQRRIGIIGAGVSGLATAKVFLSRGHAVTVFEKIDGLGGVWAPARHYPGVRLQTKRQCYSFSDFPMPSHYPEFPTGAQVYDYLLTYATHFGITEHIRFNSEVTSIAPRPDQARGWRLEMRDLATGGQASHDFDFVVVCNGIFSLPAVPQIPGRDEFEAAGGVVLHSSQLRETRQVAGRDVAVVGFGKSALDIAEAVLDTARSSTLVFRRSIWKAPHRVWGRTNIKHFILSRFTEIWFPHPDMGRMRRFLHSWLRPVVDAYWWMAERTLGSQLGMLTPMLRPDQPLRKAGACLTLALDDLKAVREGRIALQRGSVARFTAAGLELDNGKRVDAQAVVLATGFRQEYRFLGEREKAALLDGSGMILLYRQLINPDIPAMAFNGYNGVGACQLMAEVGAVWLVCLFEGRIRLPDRTAMLAKIHEEAELRSRLMSVRLGAGYYTSPFTFGYLDQLLRDMGLPPADRHKRLPRWLFEPLAPTDYRDLLQRAEPARADGLRHPGARAGTVFAGEGALERKGGST